MDNVARFEERQRSLFGSPNRKVWAMITPLGLITNLKDDIKTIERYSRRKILLPANNKRGIMFLYCPNGEQDFPRLMNGLHDVYHVRFITDKQFGKMSLDWERREISVPLTKRQAESGFRIGAISPIYL